MPKCKKCTSAPDMIRISYTKPLDVGLEKPKKSTFPVSHKLRGGGHPIMATLVTVFSAVSNVTTSVVKSTYECPNCNHKKTEYDWSSY